VLSCFGISFRLIFSDKWLIFLAAIPIFVGVIFYSLLGKLLFIDLLNWLRTWVETSLTSQNWGAVAYYFLLFLMTIIVYFLVSWTFVLFVSLVASPLNDILSMRTEKKLLGQEMNMGEVFKGIPQKILFILKNELLKISLIIVLSGIAILMSFFPLLAPVGIILSSLLLGINFIDYAWSRKDLKFRDCFRNTRINVIPYSLAGVIFMILMSIPLVNLFAYPFAVIYFTVLFLERIKRNEIISKH